MGRFKNVLACVAGLVIGASGGVALGTVTDGVAQRVTDVVTETVTGSVEYVAPALEFVADLTGILLAQTTVLDMEDAATITTFRLPIDITNIWTTWFAAAGEWISTALPYVFGIGIVWLMISWAKGVMGR
jgi:hypothetical protein